MMAAYINTTSLEVGSMKFNIARSIPRLGVVMAAGVTAISVFAAPAVIAPVSATALPIAAKCTPGQIKTVGGKKYVCDKFGHWIRVVDRWGGVVSVSTGALQSGGVVATTGATTSGPTPMEANTGGGVTCGSGSSPGDYMVQHNYIYRNGERVGYSTVTKICGEDGKWHTVARAGSLPGVTVVNGTISLASRGTRS
jgi:hypothetical protein